MTRLCRSGFKTDEPSGRSSGRATRCSTLPRLCCPPTVCRPWVASPPSHPPGLPTVTQVTEAVTVTETETETETVTLTVIHQL